MGSDDAIQFIILIILLLLSGFFSSAETALTTASQIRMRTLEEEGNKRAKTATSYHGKFQQIAKYNPHWK